MAKRRLSRRKFIGDLGCAAIGGTTLYNTAIQLGMINTASARPHILSAPPSDYKAIVCILLAGGSDSHNFLFPHDQAEYDNYAGVRANLALPRVPSDYIESSRADIPNAGRRFGLHPGMTNAKRIYDAGDLAFISNIGTLIEPIATTNELWYGGKQRPLGLYSHADQIMHWQTSVPQSRGAVGVGGRMADMLQDMNTIDDISMNISLSGRNRFQAGKTVVEYAVSNNPNNVGIEGYPSWWGDSGILAEQRSGAVKDMVEQSYANIFQDTYAKLTDQTYSSLELLQEALGKRRYHTTSFAEATLSQDMRMVADMISIQQHLGAKRQVFFTTYGGWDHHDEVINSMNMKVPTLDGAIGSLYDALGEVAGLREKVTLVTISDFGRTQTTNGNGSDHAWGGNMMIMGGSVNGGNVYGDYPDIDLDHDRNIDERGRFIPSVSCDEMYAELALWFGVSVNDLSYILPNISNFNDYSTNPAPLGLFS